MRSVHVVIFLVLTLILSGCGPTSKDRMFSKQGFSLIPPTNWKVVDQKAKGYVFLARTEQRFVPNISVAGPYPIQKADADVLGEVKGLLAKTLTDYRSLHLRKLPQSHGQAYELVHTFRLPKAVVKQKQRIIVQDGKYYLLTYSALPERYGEYEQLFDQCVSSFRVESHPER